MTFDISFATEKFFKAAIEFPQSEDPWEDPGEDPEELEERGMLPMWKCCQ